MLVQIIQDISGLSELILEYSIFETFLFLSFANLSLFCGIAYLEAIF